MKQEYWIVAFNKDNQTYFIRPCTPQYNNDGFEFHSTDVCMFISFDMAYSYLNVINGNGNRNYYSRWAQYTR